MRKGEAMRSMDEVRRGILENQKQIDEAGDKEGQAFPKTDKVFIDNKGKMKTQEEVESGEESSSSELPQDGLKISLTRQAKDRKIVKKKLPENTQWVEQKEKGISGWRYEIINDFNDEFAFFLTYDGAYYQVYCLKPEIDNKMRRGHPDFGGAHDGHIYSNGRLCMGSHYNSGWNSLEGAYAKSVLWSNGISYMLHEPGAKFPYVYNQ